MAVNKICIITTPLLKAGFIPLSNLVMIFEQITESVIVITSEFFRDGYEKKDSTKFFVFNHKKSNLVVGRIFNNIILQFVISKYLMTYRKDYDCIIFFIGGDLLVLPALLSKLLRKKTILYFAGSEIETAISNQDKVLGPIILFSKITKNLTDYIILYSDALISCWDLKKYQNKILIAHKHFLNFSEFKIKKLYPDRKTIIGYVGRLSKEKGIENFIMAVPSLVQQDPQLIFSICGEGPLKQDLEKYIAEYHLQNNIFFNGWIPHEELPDYLNDMKLLVIPSFTEGLPNIMLESMACGTPVLATSVGGIPDIIKENKTGYILKNNSPECISDGIIHALKNPSIQDVINNSQLLVQRDFNQYSVTNSHKKILEKIG